MQWLHSLGLNPKQSITYTFLLENGVQPASFIADKLGEQRTNVYLIIEQLIQKGLVEKDESQPVVRFRPANPERLLELMSQQQRNLAASSAQLKQQLPLLSGLFHLNVADEGLAYFEGLKGYSAALEDMTTSQFEVCVFGSSDISSNRPDAKDVLNAKFQKRSLAKVPTRIIFDESLREASDIPAFLSMTTKKYTELRHWGHQPFGNGEIAIYGGTVVLTSYDEKLISLVIKNPAITATFQAIFDTAWNAAT